MIRKQALGVSPSLEVTIGDASVNYASLSGITVELSENQHDYAVLLFSGLPTKAVTDYIGKGVKISFNTGAAYKHDFAGYVVAVNPVSEVHKGLINDSPFQEAEVICLGVSYDLRGAKSKSWSGYTLAEVATEICDRHGYSLDAPADPLIVPGIHQANESDWQFLVRYASQLGYVVTMHGTHMHIFDPYKAYGRQVSVHRLYTTRSNLGLNPVPGQILKFEGTFGESVSDGLYKDSLVAVLGDDGLTFDVSTSEVFGTSGGRFTDRLPDYVGSYAEAERVLASRSKECNDYRASIQVLGVAGMLPGGVVDVDNFDADYDGLWYVHSLKHEISASGSFFTTIDAGRNRRETVTPVFVERYAPPPEPRFVSGKWETSRRTIHAYT